jgi:hypothetical protein
VLVGHLRAYGLGHVCAHFVLVGQLEASAAKQTWIDFGFHHLECDQFEDLSQPRSLKLHCTNGVSLQLLQRHFLQTWGSDSSAVGI